MIGFIKKHKLLVLVFIVILIVVFVLFNFKSIPGKPTPTLSPVQQSLFWDNFKPGNTQKSDVISALGKSISEKKVNGQTVDDFKSNSPTRNHEVFFDKNTSVFFRQIVAYGEKLTVSNLLLKYGTAPNILYGPDSSAGFYLFVYPDKGVAYLGNETSGTVLEIWYFKPINTFQEFVNEINNWIPGYSTTQSIQQ